MAIGTVPNPGEQASKTLSLNMKLLAHHELGGFGGIGEGINMQMTRDGRRILWMAHEGPPKNFTAVDVTNPREPKFVVQTELPHHRMRSNSLDVVGNLMAVAYQVRNEGAKTAEKIQSEMGGKPAGFDLYDISTPEKPSLITHFDCSGKHSVGVHCLWFVDGEYIHMSAGAPDFTPRHPRDHQMYRIIDVRNPSKPVEAGRWWYPGTRDTDPEPPVARHPRFDGGYRLHNANVYPDHPDRAYIAYIDGGALVLDISDKAHPREISRFRSSPPGNGMTHTLMPLYNRGLAIMTEECNKDLGVDWPKLTWVMDAREEKNLVSIATMPMPPLEAFGKRGGRFGSHNVYENYPAAHAFRSEDIVIGTFFNAGVRVYDISNQYQPREIAYYVPGAPPLSAKGAIQINDVYVDDRQIVYACDRIVGGLYILEMNI